MVADTIGVNRSTARSIEGIIAERPCGGANNVRVDNEIKDCQNNNLNNNCMLTLTQINQELRRCLPWKPRINDRTVARTLDGMLFRFKIARHQPAERNRPDVIQKRHDYTNWFMGQAIVSHTVFVEECGYNIWTARSQGRTIRGERAYRQVCWQRGRNLTVALAISPTTGLVFHSAIIGGWMLKSLQTSWPKQDLILIWMHKLCSSTTAHQLTITQPILGPTPSLRSCLLIVHF